MEATHSGGFASSEHAACCLALTGKQASFDVVCAKSGKDERVRFCGRLLVAIATASEFRSEWIV